MRNIPSTYSARLLVALHDRVMTHGAGTLSDVELAELMPDDAPRTRREALLECRRAGAVVVEGRGAARRFTVRLDHPWWAIAPHVVGGVS